MKHVTLPIFFSVLASTAWAQNAPQRQEDESIPSYKYKVVVKDKPVGASIPTAAGWSFGPFSGPLQGYTIGPAGKGKAFFTMDTRDAGEMTSNFLAGAGVTFQSSWLNISLGYVEGVVEYCTPTFVPGGAPAPGGGFGGGGGDDMGPGPAPGPGVIGVVPADGGPVTTCFERTIRIYELDLAVTLVCYRFPIAQGIVGFVEAGVFASIEYVQVDMTGNDLADVMISGGPRVETGVMIGGFRISAQAMYMNGVGVDREISTKQDLTVLVGGSFGN